MRTQTWILGAVVLMLTAAACGSADNPDVTGQTTPSPLPPGLPPNGAANAIPEKLRPALDELADQLADLGSNLQIPTYLPEDLTLTEVGTGDDTPVIRMQGSSLVPGEFVWLRYRVRDEHVFVNVIQALPPSDDPIIFPPLTDDIRIPQTTDRRIGGFPPGEPDPLNVFDAGFVVSFQDNNENIVIEGESHRCGRPGCFTSWCTTLDCPKFPEPVARAIINSLEPYTP